MKKGEGELFLFWLLPAFGLTWILVFLIFPGFAPPMSADEVAAFYRDPNNLPLIRYSMIVFNWFSIGMIPFLTLIVIQIGRMAHRTPLSSYAYLGCLTGGPTLLGTTRRARAHVWRAVMPTPRPESVGGTLR